MRARRNAFRLGAWIAAFGAGAALAAEPGTIAEYTAEYEVRDGGRRIATAEFSVARDGGGHYVFRSAARARGLLRLLRPDAAVEESRFVVEDGRIVPQTFRYEDGSRSGDDNYSVEFDGAGGEVTISGPAGPIAVDAEPGLLDRGTLQVALMQDLGACRLPGPYRYVDEDGVREYRYERLEDGVTETGAGPLETVRFSQTREGSSRTTTLWLAPDLAFLPVRIEQVRDGEAGTVFTLESADGPERVACSGFR